MSSLNQLSGGTCWDRWGGAWQLISPPAHCHHHLGGCPTTCGNSHLPAFPFPTTTPTPTHFTHTHTWEFPDHPPRRVGQDGTGWCYCLPPPFRRFGGWGWVGMACGLFHTTTYLPPTTFSPETLHHTTTPYLPYLPRIRTGLGLVWLVYTHLHTSHHLHTSLHSFPMFLPSPPPAHLLPHHTLPPLTPYLN